MATYSTGISVTWDGTPFSEVTDLGVSYGGSPAVDRGSNAAARWSADLGSVTVTALGSANMSTTNYGKRGDLAISGGGISLTVKAIYESVDATPELNGLTRFAVSFKILDG